MDTKDLRMKPWAISRHLLRMEVWAISRHLASVDRSMVPMYTPAWLGLWFSSVVQRSL